jgi:hypothetical protein
MVKNKLQRHKLVRIHVLSLFGSPSRAGLGENGVDLMKVSHFVGEAEKKATDLKADPQRST